VPLSSRVKCYALDESGNRQAAVPVFNANGQAAITLSPQYHTLWYEVEVQK